MASSFTKTANRRDLEGPTETPRRHPEGRRVCGRQNRPQVEELYNLDIDIGEQHNIARKHPEIVSELKTLMLATTPKNLAPLDSPNVKKK